MTTQFFQVPPPVPAQRVTITTEPEPTIPHVVSLARAVIEASLGLRPLAHLSDSVHTTVWRAVKNRRKQQPARQLSVVSCRVQQPADKVAEACLHIVVDGTHRMWVFRFTHTGDAWQCAFASPVRRTAEMSRTQRLRP